MKKTMRRQKKNLKNTKKKCGLLKISIVSPNLLSGLLCFCSSISSSVHPSNASGVRNNKNV